MAPTGTPLGPSPSVIHHQPRPRGGILGVERIGRLEPGAGKAQIHAERIRRGRLEIHAVEHVLFIAVIVHDGEFRPIQEPARVHAVRRNEVAPILASPSPGRIPPLPVPKLP